MNNHKTNYTQALTKLAALVEQQKTVTAKLNGIGLRQQAAQKARDEAAEQAEAVHRYTVRGIAADDELAAANQAALAAQSVIDGLMDDERVCRNALKQLDRELHDARTATADTLQRLSFGIADQLGKTLTGDKKLRATLVDIFAAYRASLDRSLGGSFGGQIDWSGVLEGLFPLPTDAEFEASYDLLKSQLK